MTLQIEPTVCKEHGMANEVVSYMEMCQREGVSLQRGMNYEIGANHSVY
jgi:hypothetical protein